MQYVDSGDILMVRYTISDAVSAPSSESATAKFVKIYLFIHLNRHSCMQVTKHDHLWNAQYWYNNRKVSRQSTDRYVEWMKRKEKGEVRIISHHITIIFVNFVIKSAVLINHVTLCSGWDWRAVRLTTQRCTTLLCPKLSDSIIYFSSRLLSL